MAKEICMIQRSDKGREFRKYFIECEKKLKELSVQPQYQLPQTYKEALQALLEEVEKTERLETKIKQDEPYVEFAKHIEESDTSISISAFAKLMKDNDISLGRNRLFDWLRNNGYIMKDNKPYQQYLESNVFELREYSYLDKYGRHIEFQTLITPKGQIYLANKIKEYFTK